MTKAPTPDHTTGPWTADLGEAFHIRDTHGGILAQIKFLKGRGGLGGRRNGDEVAANARLIAAAPELLEVLEVFLAHEVDYMTRNCLGDPEKQHRVIQARAAIAKVKGEA